MVNDNLFTKSVEDSLVSLCENHFPYGRPYKKVLCLEISEDYRQPLIIGSSLLPPLLMWGASFYLTNQPGHQKMHMDYFLVESFAMAIMAGTWCAPYSKAIITYANSRSDGNEVRRFFDSGHVSDTQYRFSLFKLATGIRTEESIHWRAETTLVIMMATHFIKEYALLTQCLYYLDIRLNPGIIIAISLTQAASAISHEVKVAINHVIEDSKPSDDSRYSSLVEAP